MSSETGVTCGLTGHLGPQEQKGTRERAVEPLSSDSTYPRTENMVFKNLTPAETLPAGLEEQSQSELHCWGGLSPQARGQSTSRSTRPRESLQLPALAGSFSFGTHAPSLQFLPLAMPTLGLSHHRILEVGNLVSQLDGEPALDESDPRSQLHLLG